MINIGCTHHLPSLYSTEEKMLLKEENVSCNNPVWRRYNHTGLLGSWSSGTTTRYSIYPVLYHCHIHNTACKSSCRAMTACCILPWRGKLLTGKETRYKTFQWLVQSLRVFSFSTDGFFNLLKWPRAKFSTYVFSKKKKKGGGLRLSV